MSQEMITLQLEEKNWQIIKTTKLPNEKLTNISYYKACEPLVSIPTKHTQKQFAEVALMAYVV